MVVPMRAYDLRVQWQAVTVSEQAALVGPFAAIGRVRAAFLPTQRFLGLRTIKREPAPVNLFQCLTRQQPFMLEAREHPGIGSLTKSQIRQGV